MSAGPGPLVVCVAFEAEYAREDFDLDQNEPIRAAGNTAVMAETSRLSGQRANG